MMWSECSLILCYLCMTITISPSPPLPPVLNHPVLKHSQSFVRFAGINSIIINDTVISVPASHHLNNIRFLRDTAKVQSWGSMFSVDTMDELDSLYGSTFNSPMIDDLDTPNVLKIDKHQLVMHEFVSKLYASRHNRHVYLTSHDMFRPQRQSHSITNHFPPGIEKLVIKKDEDGRTIIDSFLGITWPSSLKELTLCDLEMTSDTLRTLHLPKTIEVLKLNRNNIESLHGFVLPSNVRILHLNNNQITSKDLNRIDWSSLTKLEELFLGCNRITTLAMIQWPKYLRALHLNSNEIRSVDLMGTVLPNTLKMLNLKNNKMNSFEGIYLPHKLEMLCLNGNEIDDRSGYRLINMYIPKTVAYLNVAHNNIRSLRKINAKKLQRTRGVLELKKQREPFIRGHWSYFRRKHPNLTIC
eukprot:91918_1